MFICEKCEGVGYHKLGCPDYPMTTTPPPEGTTEPRECLDDAEATVVDGWCVHVGFRHVGPCPPAPAAEDDAVAAWQARAERIIDERTAERDEARQQVADLRAVLDDERAARRIAGEAADRFRDVLADCLGHDGENPGDDVLVAEVRTHFGRTGPEPTCWRDFLTGARARLDQIEAMPDPLRAALAGSGDVESPAPSVATSEGRDKAVATSGEQPGPLKAGVMALTGLSSDEVGALGGVREDDRPAPVAPDSAGLRERLWEAIVKVRDAAPRLPDDADTDDIVDAVLAVVGQGVTADLKADGWDEAAEWVADPHIRRGIRQANPYRAVVRSGEQGGEYALATIRDRADAEERGDQ